MCRVSSFFYCAALISVLTIGARSDDGIPPRVIVVGAGASGIAAATRLTQNGFDNVIILEAQDRIGGRVHTTKFDEYVVDLGAQWVHGEKNNVVYELVYPLGLIEHASMEMKYYDMYTGPGTVLDPSFGNDIKDYYLKIRENLNFTEEDTGTLGDYFVKRFSDYFAKHPEINETLRDELLWHYEMIQIGLDPADTWFDISKDCECEDFIGDPAMNWKEKGYSTLLDVLLKKIPNPEEALPVQNNIFLNKVVAKVDYTDENGPIKVSTTDGREFVADHVIMTPSLGVMKAQHKSLFDPPLPECKVNSIKGMGFGAATKIIMAFDTPWWNDMPDNRSGFSFLWDENTRKEYKETPGTEWILNAAGFFFVQHKPRLLLCWLTGEGARLADNLSDEQLFNQTVANLEKFMSPTFNFTAPVSMIRSQWSINEHVRGAYSYRSIEADKRNASVDALAEPIMRDGKPVILFGGEATDKMYPATVHGAVASGWREADRLIDYYGKGGNQNA